MTRRWAALRRLAAVVIGGFLAAGAPGAGAEAGSGPEPASPGEAIRLLKGGGQIIFLRHTLTDTSLTDPVDSLDLADCSTQRNLTAAGRDQASRIGKAIKRLNIPIGAVLVSPYCRTRETASLVFGKHQVERGLLNTSNLTEQEKAPIIAQLRTLLGQPVAAGSNRVLVSHSSTLADGTGIFPKPEGVALIFTPNSAGGFRHVASIAPDDWEKIGLPHR